MKQNAKMQKRNTYEDETCVGMSYTQLAYVNTRSRGEVAFLDQVSNIRQAFGEKNV